MQRRNLSFIWYFCSCDVGAYLCRAPNLCTPQDRARFAPAQTAITRQHPPPPAPHDAAEASSPGAVTQVCNRAANTSETSRRSPIDWARVLKINVKKPVRSRGSWVQPSGPENIWSGIRIRKG